MNKTLALVTALMLALVITGGGYAYAYLTATTAVDVTAAGEDIATAEEAAAQPDWDPILTPEPAGTEVLRPAATGTYTQMDPRGGDPDNYLCVDEEVADEDSTWVRNNSDGTELDTYNIPAHSEGGGNITSVTVHIRSRGSNTEYLHAAETVVRTNGTDHFGSYTLLPLSYTDLSTIYTTNPDTGTDWTWDEIDALEIGVRSYDNGAGNARCTQVYVEVSFEAPPLCGEVPTGDLFDITPDDDYSGDLAVKVYLTNTGALVKAYQYLNVKLYLEGSVEAGETPNYRLLTLDNGGVTFSLKDYSPGTYTLSVTGGSYCLVSRDTAEWEPGWTVTPEFYCQILQR